MLLMSGEQRDEWTGIAPEARRACAVVDIDMFGEREPLGSFEWNDAASFLDGAYRKKQEGVRRNGVALWASDLTFPTSRLDLVRHLLRSSFEVEAYFDG